MEAGKLDRYISIERATATRSATGEKTRTWTALAVLLPAAVEFPSTRQAMNSQQMQSEIDAVFSIRYRTDISPAEDLRVVYSARHYRIKGVREIGRRVGLRLDCSSRAE